MLVPTVRGDAVLLSSKGNGRWIGADAEFLVAATGVCLDACLQDVLEVTGRRLLGIDRRRVVAGPGADTPDLPPLLARLGRRCGLVAPESPVEWISHTATFAPLAALEELRDASAGTIGEGGFRLFGRAPGLAGIDPVERAAALARVSAACAGAPDATVVGVVAAALLQQIGTLDRVVRKGGSRATTRTLQAGLDRAPISVRHFLDALADRQRAEAAVGTYS